MNETLHGGKAFGVGRASSEPKKKESDFFNPDDSANWSGSTRKRLRKRSEKYVAKGKSPEYIYNTHTPSTYIPEKLEKLKRKRENPFYVAGDSDKDNVSANEALWVGKST